MIRFRPLAAAAVLLLLVPLGGLAATGTGAADPPAGGHLVLNGGGPKPDAVMETFVAAAGGPDARIVVFPTASGEPDTGDYYRELLERYGARNVTVLEVRSPADAARPGWVEIVRRAEGVWFSGGDQRRITDALLDTPMLEALHEAHRGGAAVGGTSAGTACQSERMITGDGEFDRVTADNVVTVPGLDLLPGTILDQHFLARRRLNRLVTAVLERPDLLGIGVDEATAVWVRPDGTFRVVGDGQVVVLDAAGADQCRRHDLLLGATGVRMHLLLPGDGFDLATRRAIVGSDRGASPGDR